MVEIDTNACTGCGLCVQDCITKNIYIDNAKAKVKHPCFLCGHCVAICPQNAVSITDYPSNQSINYNAATFSLLPQNLLNAIKFRRSIRQFTAQQIEQAKLERIIEAGRYTATAVNYQDVHFACVQTALPKAKELIWQGWHNYLLEMQQTNPSKAQLAQKYYDDYRAEPSLDRLFFNAPALLVLAADIPLDGGLAAANIEMMAVAEGLGVLFDGYIVFAINHNPAAKAWLGINSKQVVAAMLLGYPAITYKRTAPRRTADILWR